MRVRIGEATYGAPTDWRPIFIDDSAPPLRRPDPGSARYAFAYCQAPTAAAHRIGSLVFGGYGLARIGAIPTYRDLASLPAVVIAPPSAMLRPPARDAAPRGPFRKTGDAKAYYLSAPGLPGWPLPVAASCRPETPGQESPARCRVYARLSDGNVVIFDAPAGREPAADWSQILAQADSFVAGLSQPQA